MTGWFEVRIDGPGVTITGCSADLAMTPKNGQSPCWLSSADWTSRFRPSCQMLTTSTSGILAPSTSGGTRGH
jgi:hypothetical protein